MLLAAITAVLGALLVIFPSDGVLSLTIALAIYLCAHGLTSLSVASAMRGATRQWFWPALGAGADFLLAGTLYPSASHPGAGGSGVEWLRRVPAAGGRLIGIGGVTPERGGEVLGAGAHGVAVISAIWNAERPREALLRFIRELYER